MINLFQMVYKWVIIGPVVSKSRTMERMKDIGTITGKGRQWITASPRSWRQLVGGFGKRASTKKYSKSSKFAAIGRWIWEESIHFLLRLKLRMTRSLQFMDGVRLFDCCPSLSKMGGWMWMWGHYHCLLLLLWHGGFEGDVISKTLAASTATGRRSRRILEVSLLSLILLNVTDSGENTNTFI